MLPNKISPTSKKVLHPRIQMHITPSKCPGPTQTDVSPNGGSSGPAEEVTKHCIADKCTFQPRLREVRLGREGTSHWGLMRDEKDSKRDIGEEGEAGDTAGRGRRKRQSLVAQASPGLQTCYAVENGLERLTLLSHTGLC